MNKPIVCLGIMVADARKAARVIPTRRLVLVDEMSLHAGGCAVARRRRWHGWHARGGRQSR
jgi:hypothetical protein